MFGAFVFRKSSRAPPPARLIAASVPENGQEVQEAIDEGIEGQDASHEGQVVNESHVTDERDPLESDPKKRKV